MEISRYNLLNFSDELGDISEFKYNIILWGLLYMYLLKMSVYLVLLTKDLSESTGKPF